MAAVCLSVLATSVQAGPGADFGGETPSDDTRQMAEWVLASADHQGQPFAIVDKKDARLFVFSANGRLLGATPALLGQAPGDQGLSDMEGRAPAQLLPAERTTPAGRFASEPGHNLQGEAVVWFNYEAALAIHRLRPAPAQERRPQRLLSDTPNDNRISLGCVIVAPSFFDAVVAPVLGRQRGVVYVLPETRPVQSLFGQDRRLALLKL
ncbi:L,D-transpeptidase [Roseateles toxinivorans]|uniref:L,D-transpeptidase-like protein n=1 Tax=Roseateles toxinivorans TaxID=270368 RepID=A0A4R6QJ31_9BURK|nr:L,D-transpeptidase [Roseateles toxinivorans]TDP63137.1 hypothetical protein DES47_105137 [Roseateles toxinivorans]